MKKTLPAILLILLVAAGYYLYQNTNKNDDVTTIGAVLPLTGSAASYGENAKNGIVLAVEEYNAAVQKNGRKKVFLEIEDSGGNPKEAVLAFQKLTRNKSLKAIVGDVTSTATLAMAPMAESRKIILISPAASAPAISEEGAYIYRTWPPDTMEAAAIVDHIKRKNYKRLALLYVDNDYGVAIANYLKTHLPTEIQIVAQETFKSNTTTVRNQLAIIGTSKPQALFFVSYPKDTLTILRQIAEGGLTVPLLSVSAFEDPSVLKANLINVEGVVYSSPKAQATQESIDFAENYRKKYGETPGIVADTAYDATKAILLSFKQVPNGTTKQLVDALNNLSFEGASGKIEFDSKGDVVKPAGLKTIKNGKFTWLEESQ